MKKHKILEKDLLIDYYINQNLTIKEIQKKLNNEYSCALISSDLKYYGITKPRAVYSDHYKWSENQKKKHKETWDKRTEDQEKERIAKIRKTKEDHYGKDFSKQIVKKSLMTYKERTGLENPFQDTEHIKECMIKKYGVSHNNYLESSREKRRKAWEKIDREKLRQKKSETCLKKYNALAPACNKEILDKMQKTMQERYGVTNAMFNLSIRGKQAKSAQESQFENRIKQFLIQNNISFSQQYLISKDNKSHAFDFAIFNKQGNLDTLIDCDGLYYHGYKSDFDGKKVNSYSDKYRMLLIPENVKFMVIEERKDEEEIYKKLLELIDIDYDKYILDLCNQYVGKEFPYPQFSDEILENSLHSIQKADVDKFKMNARYGEKLILQFHKSIWQCNKKNNISPYKAWQDKELMKKCIKNRLIYKGCNLDRSRILYGFSASNIAPKVSIFNPYLSKYLISKYLNAFDTIFDPCSGFSGRMLGAVSLGKHYIGQDINERIVNESLELTKKFNLDAQFTSIDSTKTKGCYPCLFTCSPYYNKENWGQEIKEYTCDQWIDICLNNYECEKYLFVVDETQKYKKYIIEELKNKSHLSQSKEYVILIEK